jgi:hypothetical protein
LSVHVDDRHCGNSSEYRQSFHHYFEIVPTATLFETGTGV